MGAMTFFLRQFDEAVEMALGAFPQKWVEQHGTERRAEREREGHIHVVARPAFHDLDEREVTFRDAFIEPGFFQKPLVLGMAHEGQMRVENYGEAALHQIVSSP